MVASKVDYSAALTAECSVVNWAAKMVEYLVALLEARRVAYSAVRTAAS